MVFQEDLTRVNWNVALTLHEENPNLSFKSFLNTADRLTGNYCPKNPFPKQNFKQNLNHG